MNGKVPCAIKNISIVLTNLARATYRPVMLGGSLELQLGHTQIPVGEECIGFELIIGREVNQNVAGADVTVKDFRDFPSDTMS